MTMASALGDRVLINAATRVPHGLHVIASHW